MFFSTPGTRDSELGGFGSGLIRSGFGTLGNLLGPRTFSNSTHSNVMIASHRGCAPVAFAVLRTWAKLILSKASMNARPRFADRGCAHRVRDCADDVSDQLAFIAVARDHRAQHDGGVLYAALQDQPVTTLPQHVDRGPQRWASLDGIYSISSCSNRSSAARTLHPP